MIATSPALSRRCIPMAMPRIDGHYFPLGDVTCECGRYPSEMGQLAGLTEVEARQPRYDPWALVQHEWQARSGKLTP